MPTPNTPGFRGLVAIVTSGESPATIVLPAYPGPTLNAPRGWEIPPVLGNAYQLNYGPGLIQPSVDISLMVRDVADEALGATLMGLLFGRDSTISFDTSSFTLHFWDGISGFTMTGAKIESMTLGTAKGDNIRMSLRVIGCGLSYISALPEGITNPGLSTAPLVRWNAATFLAGSDLASHIPWGFDMVYSNNHTPNLELDGTLFPSDVNAGIPTATLRLRLQAADLPGLAALNGTAICIQVGKVNASYVAAQFTVQNPLDQSDCNRRVDFPRVFREHQFNCLGVAGQEASDFAGGVVQNGPVLYSGTLA